MQQNVYEFGEFRLDAASSMLYRDGEAISLPPKAVETLLALVRRSGEIVPKDELMSLIWADSIVEESNLSQYIHILRKTLGEVKGGKSYIDTLKRRGYRFNGDVTAKTSRPRDLGDASMQGADLAGNGFGTDFKSQPMRSVERHGNVLAIAAWKEAGPDPFTLTEEIDQKTIGDKAPAPSGSLAVYLIGGALAVVLIGSIVWIGSRSNAESSLPKDELRVLALTSGEDVNFATISRDGKYFAYTSRDGEKAHLWTQQTGQSGRIEIVAPFDGTIFETSFTPDSRYVYFIASSGPDPTRSVYRVPALGGVKTKILDGADTAVSFSPDGREMAFRRHNQDRSESSLVIAASDGSYERVLAKYSGPHAISNGAAWSPDGTVIAFGALNMAERETGCTITGIKPETGVIVELSADKWESCFRLEWTKDGAGIVFVGTRARESFSTRRDQIYYLSVADGKSRRLTTEGFRHQFSSLGITDADEILAVPFNRFSQIWAMNPNGDSRSAIQITTGFADGRGGIAPLPGERAAYLTRNGDGFSIWRINGDGSERTQLTTEPSQIEELRSSADGNFLVFSATREHQAHLYRVNAAGEQLKQLTFGPGQELDSSVSPDGNWIVYESTVFDGNYGRSALWKIRAAGGELVLLADINCRTPHFSPNGKHISCVADEGATVLILSAESGETVKELPTVANSILNIGSRWMPDGKAVTYMVHSNNVVNLWVHPVNDEVPRPLTDFSSGDIYNYAFSNNGDRLYLARGYQTRNAVLISNFR